MAIRLQTEAYNLHGELFKVYLLDSEYTGDPITVEGSNEVWSIKYDGDTNTRLFPILASEARYFVRVDEDNLAEIDNVATDLLTCAEGRFTLKIMRSNGAPTPVDELFWVGYVLQDLSQFSDEQNYEFTFTATDGVGRLKSIEYKDTTGLNYQPFGNLSMLEHLLYCLNQDTLSASYFGPSDIFLRTSVNWQDGNMSAPTATKCPLAHTRVQGFVFAERVESDDPDFQWKYKSCYDVIRIICEHWAARISFSFGCYRIEQIGERDQDTFFERRFSKSGALLSSSAAAGYDKEIDQNIVGARLATGSFSYLPPLKRVDVLYEHLTFRNFLSGNGNYWYYNSVVGLVAVTITPITVDADTFFRVSGSIYINADLIADYADVGWWRYVMAMQVFIGGQAIKSHTIAATGPGGNLIPVIVRTPLVPEWVPGADNYEISSEFQASEHLEETVTFSFDTPVVPSGTSIQLSFTALGARRLDGTSEPVTLNDWRVLSPVFGIINNGQDSTFFEKRRLYQVLNTNTGNSEAITYTSVFGSAIKGWTDPKLQTSADGSTWLDTTDTWHYGAGTGTLEFGKLLATEIMAGQIFPLQRYSGVIWANQTYAHSRITFPDGSAWLMLAIEYTGKQGAWKGDWIRAGSNRSSVTQGPTVKLGDGKGGKFDPPGFVAINPGSNSNPTGTAGLPLGGNLGLNIMAINYLGSNVGAGTITSIPLQYAAEGNCLFAGDVLNIYNPSTGQVVDVTIAADVNAGDTSISIDSTTLTDDMLNGSYIFLGLVNHYTGQGSGGGNMPPGTAGQILVHNGNEWAPYSGTADGNVLTWDAVNGWQEEAPATGGGGTVTSVGLSMPAIFSVSGSPVTGAGTLTVNLANQSANLVFAGPSSGGAAAPAFRALVANDIPNLDAAKITTGIFGIARGGTGLSALGTANQLLRVNAGGTALEYFTPSYLTGNQTITLSGDVSGSGSTAITVAITANAVTDGKFRQSAGLSVVGRSANTTGDVADISAANDGEVLRRSGAALGFGTVATAGIANNAVTYAKVQNISATQRVLGRNTAGAGVMEEVTAAQVLDWIGATQGSVLYRSGSAWTALGPGTAGQLLQSGGAAANPSWATVSAVTGSGSTGHIPYWSSASALTYDSGQFFWDATNKRLGLGTSSPTAMLHVGMPTVTGSPVGLWVSGNINGNLNNGIINVNNVNANANTILTLQTGGSSAGDAILQLIAGSTWSVGVDNSDADAFLIAQNAAPGAANRLRIATGGNVSIGTTVETARVNIAGSGTTSATYSLIAHNSASAQVLVVRDDQRVGILTNAPTQELHVNGDMIARQYINTNVPPSIAYSTGAGTGPSTGTLDGGVNFVRLSFTTGTSPAANGDIFTITLNQSFPSLPIVVFSANSNTAATDYSKFYLSTVGLNSFTIKANGTLSASTVYQLAFHIGGI